MLLISTTIFLLWSNKVDTFVSPGFRANSCHCSITCDELLLQFKKFTNIFYHGIFPKPTISIGETFCICC